MASATTEVWSEWMLRKCFWSLEHLNAFGQRIANLAAHNMLMLELALMVYVPEGLLWESVYLFPKCIWETLHPLCSYAELISLCTIVCV